jgi:hypothetical protein
MPYRQSTFYPDIDDDENTIVVQNTDNPFRSETMRGWPYGLFVV